MMPTANLDFIESEAELEALYGAPSGAALSKVANRITPHYRAVIDASPFVALATRGPEGLDCSPRGDPCHALVVQDQHTVLMPDRRGNNRIDSLRNIVRDPHVALLCLVPGSGMTLRLNGKARITADKALCDNLAVDGKPPRSVIVVSVAEIYFQCARAIIRSGLWDPARHVDPAELPSPGAILEELSEAGIDGKAYDEEWPARAAKSMW